MKTIIKALHEYLSGWTKYEVTWKTDYSGVRNKTLVSATVFSKEALSTKTFKNWAAELGIDVNSLFTDFNDSEEDCNKVARLHKAFCEKFNKNLDEINSQDKCAVRYKATLNPDYKPVKTAFETFRAYDVDVLVEFKSGAYHFVFPSLGRDKDSACTRIVFSGGKMKTANAEDEAIDMVKDHIKQYIDDCDTVKKFQELGKKLSAVQKEMMKHFK